MRFSMPVVTSLNDSISKSYFEPTHMNHLFGSRATSVRQCVSDSLQRTDSYESFVGDSMFQTLNSEYFNTVFRPKRREITST